MIVLDVLTALLLTAALFFFVAFAGEEAGK